MKILIVLRSQAGVPGAAGVPGGQIGMIQLARALAQLGNDVELVVGGPRMKYLAGLDSVATTYLRWPLWLDAMIKAGPGRAKAIGATLRRQAWLRQLTSHPRFTCADVIHVQGLEDAETLLAKVPGPLVVTHWGRAGRWQPHAPVTGQDEHTTAQRQRMQDNITLVAIGTAQAEELTMAGIPPAAVITPGIDLQHFTPGDRNQARKNLGLSAGEGIVLYAGRLARDKNVAAVLKAFARLTARPHGTRLLIVGDGPLRAELRHLAAQLGIATSTSFVPFVAHENLPWYYRASDVTVVPSNHLETFCMVALEAIACGCPLIVTPFVPEILRSFPAVQAVAPDDIGSLRDQLDQALDGQLTPAGNTTMSSYDWNSIARRYLNLYQTAQRRTAS